MRRFSQRNSLVTLNDINITPLLDLAFVLLIIFVITTPLLEKGLDITLPNSSGPADKQQPNKNDIRTVDITTQGSYAMNRRIMNLDQIINQLVQDHKSNPNIVVNIRADGNSYTKHLAALLDGCSRSGITRYSIQETLQNRQR
jgi:biopolymer transport protein ExbD